MPDKITKLNEELWNSRARTYDRTFGFNRWSQKKLASLLDLTNDPCLLEIACGTSWALRYTASLTGGHGEFYGVDLASKMIEQAEMKSAAYKNIHFVRANAEELPFHDDFFNLVICTNAFHHFSNPSGVIKESSRALKPGGRIYIADTTGDSFIMRILDRLQRKLEPGHVKVYSTRGYHTFFQGAGLVYVACKTIMPALKIHVGEKD
jgi:ubiquinone/menaquinone biosynthesis C-methylase UbiE